MMKTVFIYGNFNILHPGHLRFIRFAAEQGDRLVVGINDIDTVDGVYLSNEERAEALNLVSLVQDVVVISHNLKQLISKIRPDVIVKGKEFDTQDNPEQEWLAEWGAKLVFGSGEKMYSSVDLIKKKLAKKQNAIINTSPNGYVGRHDITKQGLASIIQSFSSLKIAVFGDIIIDKYVDCEPVGMSQEDPTIVVNPIHDKHFLGGAGIVAAHAKSLGANVDLYSVVGVDEGAKVARSKLTSFGVNPILIDDESRPTTLKCRYRANGKTLLRVNEFRRHEIETAIQEKIVSAFEKCINEYDLVVFSDFSLGVLNEALVSKLQSIAKAQKVPQVADSQSSSLIGKLEKFNGLLLATPTEHEARITMQNDDDGLINVSENLGNLLNSDHLFITLNREGVLIRTKDEATQAWDTDKLPALNDSPVDTAGAGDAMLISSSLSLVAGANLWQAALIGSITAAVQVSRVGNLPINQENVLSGINEVWLNY